MKTPRIYIAVSRLVTSHNDGSQKKLARLFVEIREIAIHVLQKHRIVLILDNARPRPP